MNLFERFDRLAPGAITTIAAVGYTDGIPARHADAGWPLRVVRLPEGHPHAGEPHPQRLPWAAHLAYRRQGHSPHRRRPRRPRCVPASEVRLCYPHDLCLDGQGNLYVGDFNCQLFRRIDARTGLITRMVGSGKRGRGGDGGAATSARIDSASEIAFDREGTSTSAAVSFTSSGASIKARRHYHRRRRGESGFSPDGTTATEARLDEPLSVTTHSDGVVYFSDSLNSRVRCIARDGRLETVAGNGVQEEADDIQGISAALNKPHAIRLFDLHVLLISDFFNNKVKKVKAVRLASTSARPK